MITDELFNVPRIKLTTKIIPDEFTKKISTSFDYDFDGESHFTVPHT
jgi:hypothetical protein